MKKNLGLLMISTIVLSACGVSKTEVKTDPVIIPMVEFDPDTILSSLVTCNKASSTQDLSNVASSNQITVTDVIPNQKFEVKDCNDKVIRSGIAPAQNLQQKIDLLRPSSLQGKLEFIEIKNDRTCKTLRVKIVKSEEFQNYDLIQNAQGETSQIDQLSTRANEDGEIKVLINDTKDLILSSHLLNVADGKNLISVKYYGECLEQIEKPKPEYGPAYNCKKGKEIGSQTFGLEVNVDRSSELDEVKSTRQCDKK